MCTPVFQIMEYELDKFQYFHVFLKMIKCVKDNNNALNRIPIAK